MLHECIAEFVEPYQSGDFDEDKKFLLMQLILAPASEGDAEFSRSAVWQTIEQILTIDRQIHA